MSCCTLAHLAGGLVGEGDREDLARPRLARSSDAMRRVSTLVLPEPAPATMSSACPR
jgi:hypothetical protein